MTKIRFLAFLGLALLGATLLSPQKAEAYPGVPITYVEQDWNIATYWKWPAQNAVAFVNRYANWRMRWGKCQLGMSCIRIREIFHPGYGGITYFRDFPLQVNVDMDPKYRGQYELQLRLMVHELGHANGSGLFEMDPEKQHNNTAPNIMNSVFSTNTPIIFLPPEIDVLDRMNRM